MNRQPCPECRGALSERTGPGNQHGTWCSDCKGWWPDADGATTDEWARWRLIDHTLQGTIVVLAL